MSRNAMQWYCYYLMFKEQTQSNCTVPANETLLLLQ